MSLHYYTDWNSKDKETNNDDNDLLENLKDEEDDEGLRLDFKNLKIV